MNWKNVYRGFIMGASELIPGVSSGTIALLLGIYSDLIASINGLFSKRWAKQLPFLIPLGVGMGTALLLLSRGMDWLLANYTEPAYFLFLGIIVGVIPFLFREADAARTFTGKHYALLGLGLLIIASLVFVKDPNQSSVIAEMDTSTYGLLFISGFLASVAMILPGISGSMVFLILGVYPTVINAISDLHVDRMVVISLGIAIGIVLMSRLMHFLLSAYQRGTYAIIIGAVIGSIAVVFPGFAEETSMLIWSVVAFAIGLFIAYILGKIEYKE